MTKMGLEVRDSVHLLCRLHLSFPQPLQFQQTLVTNLHIFLFLSCSFPLLAGWWPAATIDVPTHDSKI